MGAAGAARRQADDPAHGLRTWRLLEQAASHPAAAALAKFLHQWVPRHRLGQSPGTANLGRRMTYPTRAMLSAAGLGIRMRPLTEATAKPLLPLGGKALLDHALDRLAEAGVDLVVVNTHWRADRIAAHLAERAGRGDGPETVLRREETLLDTGGSVYAALPLLGPEPFFVVNGDAFWLDGPRPALGRLSNAYDAAKHEGVLLVHRAFQEHAEVGFGDFALDKLGVLRRRAEREVVPYIFAGLQLVTPALFDDAPVPPFSMNRVWDSALARGRLRAVVHDGLWFHLSTPPDLAEADNCSMRGHRGDAVNLFTVRPDASFLDAIAAEWLRQTGDDPLAVSRGLILLPTRRAARALAEAFLRAAGGRPLLLPRISAMGALDEAPLALSGALDLPPAVEPARRLAVLSLMILRMRGAGGAPHTADRAWRLAGELCTLMDEGSRPASISRRSFPMPPTRNSRSIGGRRSVSCISRPPLGPRGLPSRASSIPLKGRFACCTPRPRRGRPIPHRTRCSRRASPRASPPWLGFSE